MITEASGVTRQLERSSLIEQVIGKVADASIDVFPFPHIILAELVPPVIYEQLLSGMPPRSEMTRVEYPGTGFGRKNSRYHDFGYAYDRLHSGEGPLTVLRDVFSSPQFAETLLRKFSRPLPDGFVPIPLEKHQFFAEGARNYTTVFDLQVDLPGYAIAPHRDLPAKIVTFQFFLTPDESLADYGTLLCRPRDARAQKGRGRLTRLTDRAFRKVPRDNPTMRRVRRTTLARIFRRLERSRLGLTLGIGDTANWLPWEWFDIVKTAPALPNHFLAFAPNDKSFHAVNLDIPVENPIQERRVVRGFIMSGRNARNWIKPATGR